MLLSSWQALISVFILEKGVSMKKIRDFFKEVRKEVKKVKWPTKKDMFKYSVTTIIFIVFFAVFFAVMDIIISYVRTLVN